MRKINEIFYSLQGEGYFTGTPAVFVRFSGCNLKCPFCDTQHEKGEYLTDEQILTAVTSYPARHVILTGGEPGLAIDEQLTEMLHAAGKFVQIETNGTCRLPENIDWVTCSPKQGTPVRIKHADEIKIVYTGQNLSEYEKIFPDSLLSLQPCSMQNTDEVVDYVLKHPRWRLSVQLHKLLQIP